MHEQDIVGKHASHIRHVYSILQKNFMEFPKGTAMKFLFDLWAVFMGIVLRQSSRRVTSRYLQ
jgi:hypothetical protein